MNIVQAYKIYQEIKKANNITIISVRDYTEYQVSTPQYNVILTKNDVPFDEEGEYSLSATDKRTGKKIYTDGITAALMLLRIQATRKTK